MVRYSLYCTLKSDVGSHDGFKADDSKKMANIFNEVFVNTAQKINEKIPRTKKSPLDYLSSKNAESLSLQ